MWDTPMVPLCECWNVRLSQFYQLQLKQLYWQHAIACHNWHPQNATMNPTLVLVLHSQTIIVCALHIRINPIVVWSHETIDLNSHSTSRLQYKHTSSTYWGSFSLRANFPKLAHNSGKFILMLYKVWLWVTTITLAELNISLKLTCWIQCRTLLSNKTASLQLQLLILKL